MKRSFPLFAAVVVALVLVATACSQAAPAPTQAPAAKPAAASTSAPAAAPTSAPAATAAAPAATTAAAPKTVQYPEKGKPITIIVPWAAGSVNDVLTRMVATYLEPILGTPVQISDVPGAGTQTGMTNVAQAKPDGYTLGMNSLPTTATIYLDPSRKASFSRKDFAPIAVVVQEAMVFAVKADGPYKTMQDLVNAAKANPGKITVADGGYMTISHNATMALNRVSGAKFTAVHFAGSSEDATAVLGGHVDAYSGSPSDALPLVKNGQLRVLATTDSEPSKLYPGVQPLKALGYDVTLILSRGYVAPGGTPKEIVDILSNAFGKVVQNPEFLQKAAAAGMNVRYLDSTGYVTQWDQNEALAKQLLQDAASEPK